MRVALKVDPRLKIEEPWNQPAIPELVYLVGGLDEEKAACFRRDLEVAECNANIAGQKILPICIDSYGGGVYEMMSCLDAIDACEIDIATIVEGKAMSAGAIIFSCGKQGLRFMGPNATLMIHAASGGVEGNADIMRSEADEITRLSTAALKRLAINCKKPEKFFVDYIKSRGNAEIYLSAKQCKRLGITNHIKIPRLTVEISATHTFEF